MAKIEYKILTYTGPVPEVHEGKDEDTAAEESDEHSESISHVNDTLSHVEMAENHPHRHERRTGLHQEDECQEAIALTGVILALF